MSLKSNEKMSLRLIAVIAVMSAFSIIFGKYLAVNVTDWVRLSFENLPIIICGILLGPIPGVLCGVCADLIGCFLVGYSINPLITLGAAFIGLVPGITVKYIFKKISVLSILISVASAHLIGSIIIKSAAFVIWIGAPLAAMVWRIPVYIAVAAAEAYLIYLMHKKDVFKRIYPEGVSR